MALNSKDEGLRKLAQDLIGARFQEGKHHVASAIRTTQGEVFVAVHLEATIGRVAVCAEAVALGMALSKGDAQIDTIVAVDRHGNVMPPCGMCREMIADYSPEAQVIVPTSEGGAIVSIESLLPFMGKRRLF